MSIVCVVCVVYDVHMWQSWIIYNYHHSMNYHKFVAVYIVMSAQHE